MRCESCNNHAMELFPATKRDEVTKQVFVEMWCIECAPPCEYPGIVCGEPRDHRSDFYCTAHALEDCRFAMSQYAGDAELVEECRRTIAELEGRTEMRLAA